MRSCFLLPTTSMATAALHQVLVDTVTHEHDCVLQFDSQRQVLRSWLW